MQKLIYILLFVCGVNVIHGQLNPQQTMYMFNAMATNAGATGQYNALNATMSHRAMWQGISGAPKTQYLSISTPLKNEKIALGVQLIRDKIGVSSKTSFLGSGAYRMRLGHGKLSFGLTLGLTNGSNMLSNVSTTEDGDYVFNSGDLAYYIPSAGAGVYYETKSVFAGISVPQFFTETYVGGNQYRGVSHLDNNSYHLMAGKKISISDKMQLQGSTLIKYHKGGGLQTDLTAMVQYAGMVDIGITVRPKDALSLICRAKVNDQLRVAYSYDYLTSDLSRYDKGTHELAIIYTFIYNSNAPNTRFF